MMNLHMKHYSQPNKNPQRTPLSGECGVSVPEVGPKSNEKTTSENTKSNIFGIQLMNLVVYRSKVVANGFTQTPNCGF